MRMTEAHANHSLPGCKALAGLLMLTATACEQVKSQSPTEPDAASPWSDGGAMQCSTHKDCVDRYEAHYICRAGQCVDLLGDHCEFVGGDDTRDEAILIGLLAPDVGKAQVFAATEVVRKDFEPGLPVAGESRPLVLIGCTFPFGKDPLPAARHLVQDVGVPVVIGPATSADAINVAQNVTIPAGALLLSPYAQSDLLTDLADQDLVFRTAARTTSFAPLLAAMLSDVENLIGGERKPTGMKVALIAARDTYGIALSEATTSQLRFNGKSADDNLASGQFLAVSYDAAEPGYETDVAERVIAFAPDVIVSLSGFDVRPFKAIEEAWPSESVAAPHYVMDGVGGSKEYAAFIAERPDSLRLRVRIVSNGDPQRPLYLRYVERVSKELGGKPELLVGATAYDATYALGYAIVAEAEAKVTGKAVARGLRRLTGKGQPVVTFPSDIGRALQSLDMQDAIDLEGVSGPLDFDEHGDVSSDCSVSCYVRTADGTQVAPSFSGQVYRASAGKLEGNFVCK